MSAAGDAPGRAPPAAIAAAVEELRRTFAPDRLVLADPEKLEPYGRDESDLGTYPPDAVVRVIRHALPMVQPPGRQVQRELGPHLAPGRGDLPAAALQAAEALVPQGQHAPEVVLLVDP